MTKYEIICYMIEGALLGIGFIFSFEVDTEGKQFFGLVLFTLALIMSLFLFG